MDKNELLDKFSNTFWIEKDKMQTHFSKNNLENFDETLVEFEEMRNKVFDFIWRFTEPNKTLSPDEISDITNKYLLKNYSWIDEKGIKSVQNHILWMCWHEGIMKT
ncbi:MAG: hypothetical protein QM564_00835 [Bergeyella sp.]